jgi:hypothetical protein
MFRATFALVVALLLAPAALASHPSWILDRKENLDADRAFERVVASDNADHANPRAMIAAVDRCGGRERKYALAAPGTSIGRDGILGARALGRPGVLFTMTYRDKHEIARVVQLRAKRKGACPTPSLLLNYSSARPPYPPPEGFTIRDAKVEPGEHSSAYAGPELLLTEEYTSPRMSPIRHLRKTYFRYAAAKRRYVPYDTQLIPPA